MSARSISASLLWSTSTDSCGGGEGEEGKSSRRRAAQHQWTGEDRLCLGCIVRGMLCVLQKREEAKPKAYHSGVGRYISKTSTAGSKRKQHSSTVDLPPQLPKKTKIRSTLGDFSGW